MLRLNLFGSPQIEYNHLPLTEFHHRKAAALLFYLALMPGKHYRHHLANLLWSDLPEDKALSNLRYNLWQLRQAMPQLPLNLDRLTVSLPPSPDVWIDVNIFRTLLSDLDLKKPTTFTPELTPPLQQATDLYRGDFLAGFELSGASFFEDWVQEQRVALHELNLAALNGLSTFYLAQGQIESALRATKSLLRLEPWQEGAHRQMMLLLVLAGRRGAALEHYEACRRLLADQLELEPEPETSELWERIRSGQRFSRMGGQIVPEPGILWLEPSNGEPARAKSERTVPPYRHSYETFKVLVDLQQAGRQAEASRTWSVALECYQQALRYWESLYLTDSDVPLETRRQRWELLLRQAEVSQRLGQREEQRIALEVAACEAIAWGDEGDQLLVIIPRLNYLRQVGELDHCQDLAREGLTLARSTVDRLAEGECWQVLGDCERDRANYTQALENYEAALINFSQHKQVEQTAFCLIRIGSTYLTNNQFGRAIACLQEAAAYARTEMHHEALARALLAQAYASLLLGNLEKARSLNSEALALSESASLRSARVLALSRQGYLDLLTGDLRQARQQLEQAWMLAQEIGYPQTLADMHLYWGRLCLAEAEPQFALTHFKQAQTLGNLDVPHSAIEILSYQALAYLGLGQTEPALTCSREAINRLQQRRGGLEAAQRIYFNHYRVLLAVNETDAAKKILATARQLVLAQVSELTLAAFTPEPVDTVREQFLNHLPWNREIMVA